MTTTDQTAVPLKLARDALPALPQPALWLAWNTSYTGIRFWTADAAVAEAQAATGLALTGFYSAEQMRAAIDALPARAPFPLETVTRMPPERVTELFSRWAAARQQHPAPPNSALCMNEEFLLCLDAFDRPANVPAWPCHCDEQGIGVPGETCGDCPRDYGHTVAPAAAPAAPAPASVPAGWRMEAMAPYGYAVHAPSGAACIVRESDDSPRIVPTVVLAELCRDLLATVAVPAVAAPEPQGWQPIETAPEDGSEVLCYGKAYHPKGWSGWTEELDEDHPTAYGWAVRAAYFRHGNWQIGRHCGFKPTLWQPLPAAPTTQEPKR